jgi:hypothetical protein
MSGHVPNDQDQPLDPEAYKHQLLLLKSAHCCRPVVHQGLYRFINGLTLHQDGGRVGMTVYLMGMNDHIDYRQVQIKPAHGDQTAREPT